MITHPPKQEPYAKPRSEIIKLVSLSGRKRYQALTQHLDIGESKPSELYQRMKQLLNNENLDAFFSPNVPTETFP